MNWNDRFAGRTASMKRSAVREFLKLTSQPGMISFAGGLPAPELFPVDEIREATEAIFRCRPAQALQYGEAEGVAELRDWIAQEHSRPGLSLTCANVMVTTGSQQGIDLLGRVFLDPADAVAVENPTYLATLSAWRPFGVRFLPAPCDADGLRADSLAEVLALRPKLLYTIPNFQNPQGTTLAVSRRQQLANVLQSTPVVLIEDNPYGELRYEGEPSPHLYEFAARKEEDARGSELNSIYLGTFSKVLAPGFRVGWVIGPEAVIEKLVQAKQAADLHTSTLCQHVALELVRRGTMENHLPRLRAAYRERRDTMLAALERHFPTEAHWTRPRGGMFLMVTLPGDIEASDLLREALVSQVAFVPGNHFHLDESGKHTLRLNFSNASPERIEEGIRRLGRILKGLLLRAA
jgi:2-aminoadipate transaminase